MSVSLNHIAESFSDCKLVCHFADEGLKCLRLFHGDQTEFEASSLYVGFVSELPELRPNHEPVSFFLINDRLVPKDFFSDKKINMIITNKVHTLVDACNRIQDFFINERAAYHMGRKKLTQAITEGSDLKRMIEIASQYLGNPIMLCDKTFSVKSFFENGPPPDDPMWEYALNNGHMPDWYLNELYEYMEQQRISARDVTPHIWERGHHRKRLLLSRVIIRHEEIANVTILEHNRNFTKTDVEFLTMFCSILSAQIQCEMYGIYLPKSKLEAFLLNLLSSTYTLSSSINSLAHQCCWQPEEDLYVLCIESTNASVSDNKLAYYKEKLQKLLSCKYSVVYQRKIVFILDRARYVSPLPPDVKSELTAYLLSEKLAASLSRCYHDLGETHKYFKQAHNLLLMEPMEPNSAPFLDFDDCALQLMIDVCAQKENLMEFCHPVVTQLVEYDARNNTRYKETLFVYLKHSQDMKLSSAELFIHYNTMKYRTQKLHDQFGINFGNGTLMLHLWMSFLILDYLQKR